MKRILISDDIEIIRNTLKKIVKNIDGIEIVGLAGTYDAEIDMINRFKPDIVITDIIKNKQENTFEIVKQYSNKQYSPKFLFVSGLDKEYIKYEVIKNKLDNVAGYIHKPFSELEIENSVKEILL